MAIFRGIGFPFGRGATSFPREATDDELIRESLMQLVMTARGERIMRPDFGTNVWKFIFEANDQVMAELVRADVRSAIARFEPRVIVRNIDVERVVDGALEGVTLTIEYVVVATRTVDAVSMRVG